MLRDFRPGDQEDLRRLILAGMQERWGETYDPDRNHDLSDFQTNYVGQGAEVVVIEVGGELVATGTLVPESSDTGRIVRMSVARTHRRRGLARRVVDELVDRARRRDMTELHVLTDSPWLSAVALYRACGFTELRDDGIDTHFRMEL